MAIRFEQSRIFAGVGVQAAYDAVRPAPLPVVFAHRTGPLPPITDVTDQTGAEWGVEVGQTRRIHLGDGGSTFETLTSLDPPHSFGYTLTEITGPMKLLVATLRGRWGFAEEAGGTRVAWTWDVDPRTPLAVPLVLGLRVLWRSYAATALVSCEGLVPKA